MYFSRPIRFSRTLVCGLFKTYGFLADGISKSPPHSPRGFASSSGSTAKTLFRVRLYNTASYAGYVNYNFFSKLIKLNSFFDCFSVCTKETFSYAEENTSVLPLNFISEIETKYNLQYYHFRNFRKCAFGCARNEALSKQFNRDCSPPIMSRTS